MSKIITSIGDFVLLNNEAEARQWFADFRLNYDKSDEGAPESYPCLADWVKGEFGNQIPMYVYLADAELMQEKLQEAHVAAKAAAYEARVGGA